MAGICTGSVRRGGDGCDHRDVTVVVDGKSIVLDIGEAELDAMLWGDNEKRQFTLWGLRRLRAAGLSLDNVVGRVITGEEGSNVKSFTLLAKDVTRSNIGTAYVNVPPGLNGERSLVDFTGCTQFRVLINLNAIGTGPWGVRVIRDRDSAVLFENAVITGAGEKELDSDWQPLPPIADGLMLLRLQARSNTAVDDPVLRRCILFVR